MAVVWNEPPIAVLAARMASWRRAAQVEQNAVAIVWGWPTVAEGELASLLLACGMQRVSFYTEKEKCCYEEGKEGVRSLLNPEAGGSGLENIVSAPFRIPEQEEALLYFLREADEAGYAALASEGAGAYGAAFSPFPGGGVLMSAFGNGTEAAILTPAEAAFPSGSDMAEPSQYALSFVAALMLYGAGAAPIFLAAADKVRRQRR